MGTYLIDIDGTIANNDHRQHLIKEQGWDAFFSACWNDAPVEHMRELLCDLDYTANTLLYVTGRPERIRSDTKAWLEHHGFPMPCELVMRKDGDHRPDEIVKAEMLNALCQDGYVPTMAFDDRNKVVAMWRAHGVPCAQVAEGDF